jgi:hypothetical protein
LNKLGILCSRTHIERKRTNQKWYIRIQECKRKPTRSPTPECIIVLLVVLLIIFLNSPFRTHTDVLEPIRTTILPVEPFLAISKAASDATSALWRVWTVEEGDMLVSDILEPMDLAGILEETQSNTVDGSITPAFIEETTGAIEMVKVFLVCRRAPEVHVCNLKVAPEVAGAVAVCLDVVVWSAVLVGQPFHGVVGVLVVAVRSEEFDSFRP